MSQLYLFIGRIGAAAFKTCTGGTTNPLKRNYPMAHLNVIMVGESTMQVRVRFGRGTAVTRRRGKNSRIAGLAASVLTLAAISFFVLAAWRLGMDLNIAGDFVFPTGILSHWQVWMAAAAATQYGCWRLTRYARQAWEPEAQEG